MNGKGLLSSMSLPFYPDPYANIIHFSSFQKLEHRVLGVALPLNEANLILLRNKLKCFCNSMNPTDRNQFIQYVAMLNSLINEE
jgi:hypothetical protein